MAPIRSLTHPSVKQLYKLRKERKTREEEGLCLLYSIQLLEEIGQLIPLHELWIPTGMKVPSTLNPNKVIETSKEVIQKITGLRKASDGVGVVSLPKEKPLLRGNRLLLLDQISDPGNLGTLIRAALAFGWEGVYLTEGSVDPFNDKAIRAARGALFTLPYQRGSIEKVLDTYKDYPFLLADPQGSPIKRDLKIEGPLILALGNEAHGLSASLLKKGKQIAIPMSHRMESLNVAVAGGILLYQLGMDG